MVAFTIPFLSLFLSVGQWSFPLNLPIRALGVTLRGSQLRELPGPDPPPLSRARKLAEPPEWLDEIQFEIIGTTPDSVRQPFFTNRRAP